VFIKGDIGVNIFFVISGFLITTLALKEKVKTGKISLPRFYTRRLLRILPVAYLLLIILFP
jgi:peptidoglycan/LPS O-acetylase OafA/YrhL